VVVVGGGVATGRNPKLDPVSFQWVRSLAYYDSLRAYVENLMNIGPLEHSAGYALFALAYAAGGRREEAIQAAQQSVAMRTVEHDPLFGPQNLMFLAGTYIMVGEYEKARRPRRFRA
jgi:hypothetical protein